MSVVVINSNMNVSGILWLALIIVLFFLIDYSKFKNLRHGSGSLSSFPRALSNGRTDFPLAVVLKFFRMWPLAR